MRDSSPYKDHKTAMVELFMTIHSHNLPECHASFENIIPILQMWDCGPRLGLGPPLRALSNPAVELHLVRLTPMPFSPSLPYTSIPQAGSHAVPLGLMAVLGWVFMHCPAALSEGRRTSKLLRTDFILQAVENKDKEEKKNLCAG